MHWIASFFVIASILLITDCLKGRKKYSLFGYILTILGLVVFVLAFLLDDFTLKEVFENSSRDLSIFLKLSASWSGSGGFVVWWLSTFSLLTLLRFKKINEKEIRYYNAILISLIVLAGVNGAFATEDFVPKNGIGLNPLLKTVWMFLHPSATFIGYALGLIVGIDAILGRFNKVTVSLAWFFITIANILGGVWAYFTLGWGGYWAWDPVETALLLPWLSLTALFHSKNKQPLMALTGFSVMFSAFVTRGGVSYIHGFATNPFSLIILLFGVPFLLIFLKRYRLYLSFDPTNIASLAFLGSYFVCLLGLAYQILMAFLGNRVDVSVDYFNFANMPFLVVFLSVLPICNQNIPRYKEMLTIVFTSSVILSILTAFGYVDFSPAPVYVNIAQAFVIPIAIFSFLATLRMRGMIKILHIAIPLIVISATVSFPYTYPDYSIEAIKSTKISVGKFTILDDVNFSLMDVYFEQSHGKVYYYGIELPEEAKEILNFSINGSNFSAEIRVYPTKFLDYLSCIHMCSFYGNFEGCYHVFCKKYYPVLDAIAVVNEGLNNYYLTLSEGEYFCFGVPKNAFSLSYSAVVSVFDETKIEKFVKGLCGDSIPQLSESREYIVTLKFIPLVNLLWIGCALLVIGEIVVILHHNLRFKIKE